MDPLTSFVTIVSLLAAFESSSQGRKDIKEFKDWLNENNYAYMTAIIDNNESLQQDLTSFMNQNHNQLMGQLSVLNDLMVSIGSRVEGLGKIASNFDSNAGLSEQAIDVLRQFVESDSARMIHIQTWSFEELDNIYSLDNGGVEYSEPRFIEDDVDSLVDAGLITKTLGKNEGFIYKITRQAVAFIEAIDNKN